MVEGGNTFYLLQQIQQSDSADVIHNYVKEGKVYIGSSAGSVIAGPDIYPLRFLDEPKEAPDLKGYTGLKLVDFVVVPHWGSEHFREKYMGEQIKNLYDDKNKIILLNDNQYIEVKDDWYRIVE